MLKKVIEIDNYFNNYVKDILYVSLVFKLFMSLWNDVHQLVCC